MRVKTTEADVWNFRICKNLLNVIEKSKLTKID